MMGWQWHQLDHMQIICTSLQIGNRAITSSRQMPFLTPNSVKALKAHSGKNSASRIHLAVTVYYCLS